MEDSAYIRDLPPWMLEDRKYGMGNKTKDGKEYWLCKEHRSGKGNWVIHKPEDHMKWNGNSSIREGSTNPPNKGDNNMNPNPTKDLKEGLVAIKYQMNFQEFPYKFNINAQGND